jgi:hypothetical protein
MKVPTLRHPVRIVIERVYGQRFDGMQRDRIRYRCLASVNKNRPVLSVPIMNLRLPVRCGVVDNH